MRVALAATAAALAFALVGTGVAFAADDGYVTNADLTETAAAAPALFRRIRGWCLKSKFWTLPNNTNKNPSYKARVFIFTLNSRQNSNRKTDRIHNALC